MQARDSHEELGGTYFCLSFLLALQLLERLTEPPEYSQLTSDPACAS